MTEVQLQQFHKLLLYTLQSDMLRDKSGPSQADARKDTTYSEAHKANEKNGSK
jgi:hypothetical protein